jgi:hypothetical protein
MTNSDTLYFTDGASPANIIAQVDANGITTTQLTVKNNKLANGLGVCLIDTTGTITINNI